MSGTDQKAFDRMITKTIVECMASDARSKSFSFSGHLYIVEKIIDRKWIVYIVVNLEAIELFKYIF